jgi:hypothetical protein
MKTVVAVVAVVLLAATLSALDARQSSPQVLFERALALEEVQGKVTEAIAVYQQVVVESKDKTLAARAQLRIGLCYERLGLEKAREAFESIRTTLGRPRSSRLHRPGWITSCGRRRSRSRAEARSRSGRSRRRPDRTCWEGCLPTESGWWMLEGAPATCGSATC